MLSPPPLTNTSTISEESAEEFPLQESYETGSAILTKAEYTPQPSIKSIRTTRFCLRSITRPFTKFIKNNRKLAPSRDTDVTRLASAQKSRESIGQEQRRFRVSFSPSIEDDTTKRARNQPKTRLRRASFSDSIGKSHKQPPSRRALSISWDQRGVHPAGAPLQRSQSIDKGRALRPRKTKQQVVAAKNAARHARALEQIINAGASLSIDSVDDLKAKRNLKSGGKLDQAKVQVLPAVSPRKAKALNKALLDSKTANEIIGELRALQIGQTGLGAVSQETGQTSEGLERSQKDVEESDKTKQLPSQPVRAVCLECREEEIEGRLRQTALASTAVRVIDTAPSGGTGLWGWTYWLKSQDKGTVKVSEGEDASEATSPNLPPTTPAGGLLPGISPISFFLSPATAAAAFGAAQIGAFDTIGSLSGAAVHAANGGLTEMQSVHPPLDRLAILVHWWGFELTIPGASMVYLNRAQNISDSLMGILHTIAVSSGVPEILPFIRYLSTFVDMEFSAIKSQNHGHGVIVAATWLMPMALVPRPWDYPTGPFPSPSYNTST